MVPTQTFLPVHSEINLIGMETVIFGRRVVAETVPEPDEPWPDDEGALASDA